MMYKFIELEDAVSLLQGYTKSKLRVSGNERACKVVNESHIDVLRTGFVTREHLTISARAALGFMKTCVEKQNIEETVAREIEAEAENNAVEAVRGIEKAKMIVQRFRNVAP